jgi:hypothetical protein
MPYYFYIDKILLPVAPSKMQTKINNKNKTMTLINDGEVNILKTPGLTEVSFEALLPNTKYPFATYKNGFKNAAYFLNEIEKLKVNRKVFQFIVSRTMPKGKVVFHTNLQVTIEEYSITEDANNGFDVTASINLKQYRKFEAKTIKIQKSQTNSKATSSKPRSSNKQPPKTHKVVKGDCLWNISKKYLGDGSKYKKIYELNKKLIDSRNKNSGQSKYTIYPGQVLKLE